MVRGIRYAISNGRKFRKIIGSDGKVLLSQMKDAGLHMLHYR